MAANAQGLIFLDTLVAIQNGNPVEAIMPAFRTRTPPEQLRLTETAVAWDRLELVQAILNMISTDPVAPYKMRETFRQLWKETYDEDKTSKESWNLLRLAMRHGKIGKTENGLIYPRHV